MTRTLNARFAAYETSAEPFRIGLAPLDPAHFIVSDEEDAEALAEKRRLVATGCDAVFQARTDSAHEQAEAAELVANNLRRYHGREIAIADRPLLDASLKVQEDLLVMRREANGDWRLVAGSLCFPSSWNLHEKFDRPLTAIHAPVPRLEERMGARIRRMFDMMRPERPMWRQNWSIHGDGERRHVRSASERHDWDSAGSGEPFLRLEYQTLWKLPLSNSILFTVRIFSRPFARLRDTKTGRALAEVLSRQLGELADDEADYKGLAARRGELTQRLREVAR